MQDLVSGALSSLSNAHGERESQCLNVTSSTIMKYVTYRNFKIKKHGLGQYGAEPH